MQSGSCKGSVILPGHTECSGTAWPGGWTPSPCLCPCHVIQWAVVRDALFGPLAPRLISLEEMMERPHWIEKV